jgi:NAD(P)H-nitrite reductase large subunit
MKRDAAKFKYLIIGNSAGGIGAAEAIRQVDRRGTLAIVSDEPYPAYSRPLIAEYLADKCPLEKMLFRSVDFYDQNNLHILLSKKVRRIDTEWHAIELESRERIGWQKLLLATGGLPVMPQIEGVESEGVFTFTTLDDAKVIDQFLAKVERAVVIGGGLIGVSVTEALVKRGIEVTIVEMEKRILGTILDEEASALAEEALRQNGVSLITGHTVAQINSTKKMVRSITLDDGSIISTNLVIVAVGVQPRTELVAKTGLRVNRGVVVDCYMATSCPGVYACGDAAEAYDFIYGENRLTPIWPNAYLGGRTAGFNMAGIPTEYRGGTAMNSLTYFGLDIVTAGMVNPPDNSYEVLHQKSDHAYHKVVLKDGLVVGMVFAGDIEKSGIIFSLMKEGIKASDFKQALIADDFGLVSLPEEIWRPRLQPIGAASPITQPPEPEEAAVGD